LSRRCSEGRARLLANRLKLLFERLRLFGIQRGADLIMDALEHFADSFAACLRVGIAKLAHHPARLVAALLENRVDFLFLFVGQLEFIERLTDAFENNLRPRPAFARARAASACGRRLRFGERWQPHCKSQRDENKPNRAGDGHEGTLPSETGQSCPDCTTESEGEYCDLRRCTRPGRSRHTSGASASNQLFASFWSPELLVCRPSWLSPELNPLF
jgi:hypothetical protein